MSLIIDEGTTATCRHSTGGGNKAGRNGDTYGEVGAGLIEHKDYTKEKGRREE